MSQKNYKFSDYGDASVLIEFSKVFSMQAWQKVHHLANQLLEENIPGILGIIPTYTTLFISYDYLVIKREKLQHVVEQYVANIDDKNLKIEGRIFKIPVVFGGKYGPDLEYVADSQQLSNEKLIEQFCSKPLQIMVVNRGPMFGTNFEKEVARLETPRTAVPAGAITAAGEQISIMIQKSPGGWRIFGQTPIQMKMEFEQNPPVYYKPGDMMTFYPIGEDDYSKFEGQTISDVEVKE